MPVLKKEVIEYLDPKPGENFIDCTFGWGGHSYAILERTRPNGLVLGLDLDEASLNRFCAQVPGYDKERLILVNKNFSELKRAAAEKNFKPVAGVLFDLGMSSWHLSESGKGFSFLNLEELDMRYSSENPLTAADLINRSEVEHLEKIFREYGEERFSRQIAKKIAQRRQVKPIKTTADLVAVVGAAIPSRFRRGKTHFATRIFQALRIAVNAELENLAGALPQAFEILEPGGRLAVISFHSIEDRIVKNFFRGLAKEGGAEILTKKPVVPTWEEIKSNPRARSAKLRAIKKT